MKPRNAGFDDDPDGYELVRSGWMQTRRVGLFQSFLSSAHGGSQVLEIGCGTGSTLHQLATQRPDLEFTGIEPISRYVQYAQAQSSDLELQNVDIRVGTAEDASRLGLPAPDRIISSDVLHHVEDQDAALTELWKVSPPGALWMVIEPSSINPYIHWYQARTPGERNFKVRPFLADAQLAGWDQVGRRSYRLLIPASVKSPPIALQRIESALEGVPLLGGAVVLVLRRNDRQLER